MAESYTSGQTARPEWDDVPDVPEERRDLVKKWEERVKESEKHWEPLMKRMRECEQLAFAGADKEWVDADSYTVPIIPRHINQSVATLYAKDPRVLATRRKKLMYKLWDGDPRVLLQIQQKIQAAQQAAAVLAQQVAEGAQVVPGSPAPMAPDPMMGLDEQEKAILLEVAAVEKHNKMVDKIGKTLELLWTYYIGEQSTNFKSQMKALVRRAKTVCVGYCKLGYQRILEPNPDVTAQIQDVTSKIANTEALLDKASADKLDECKGELEQLRLNLKDLQSQEMMVVREGPVFSWPRGSEIIIDKEVRHLKTLEGAGFYAHKMAMTPDRVLAVYKLRLGHNFTKHYPVENGKTKKDEKVVRCNVYEVHDVENKQCFTIIEGYPDFVIEPQEPDVKIERFWNIFPLVFNEVENEDEKFPPADAWLMRHPQKDINRARQGLREHRTANRPKYVAPASALEDEDKTKLTTSPAHAIIEVQGLQPGEDINKKIQKFDHTGIDPNQYQVEEHFKDVLRSVGAHEANLGPVSGGTATESSIAENSRMTSASDNVDELDDFLSELARAFGQLCLLELGKQTVEEIVGPGAVWPDMPPTREQVAKDLLLEIRAGSSGRPNKAAELANQERAMPYVLQLPGINPEPLAKKYADLLDIDMDELYVAGLPSIAALNQLAGKPQLFGPGQGAGADPNQQGAQGAQNAPNPVANEPAPQPAFPAPAAGTAPGNQFA